MGKTGTEASLLVSRKHLTSWKDGSRRRDAGQSKRLSLSMVLNILMIVIALWATRDSWWWLINVVRSSIQYICLIMTYHWQTVLSTTSHVLRNHVTIANKNPW